MEGAIRLFEDHKSKSEIIRRSQIDNQREKENIARIDKAILTCDFENSNGIPKGIEK